MSKVMVSIRYRGETPTLDEIRSRYALSESEIDARFGATRVSDGVVTVLVDAEAADKLTPTDDWVIEGPFSNPSVQTTG